MKLAAVALVAGCGRIAFDPRGDAGSGGDDALAVHCGTEPSLVACWAFEGSTGDTSGTGNDASGTVPTFVPGHLGAAALFDASIDLTVVDSPSLDPVHATVMAWVKLDTAAITDSRAVILDRNDGIALFVRNTGRLGVALSTTTTSGGANDVALFPIGQFTHVAASYDGAAVRMYINGSEVAMGGATGDLSSSDTLGSRIGGNAPDTTSVTPQPWLGVIDELGVWNEALSAAQISDAAAR